MSYVQNCIEGINWKLLRKQKAYCVNEAANKSEDYPYAGIVNLFDAIQDAAVEDGIATEREVFGKKQK